LSFFPAISSFSLIGRIPLKGAVRLNAIIDIRSPPLWLLLISSIWLDETRSAIADLAQVLTAATNVKFKSLSAQASPLLSRCQSIGQFTTNHLSHQSHFNETFFPVWVHVISTPTTLSLPALNTPPASGNQGK